MKNDIKQTTFKELILSYTFHNKSFYFLSDPEVILFIIIRFYVWFVFVEILGLDNS